MAVNWFEGGRRLTKLAIAGTALIGGYALLFEYQEPALEFYVASPLEDWELRLPAEHPEPADECFPSETLWGYEIKPSVRRDVSLCFGPDGKSDAEIANEMASRTDFDIIAAREQGYTDPEIIDYLRLRLRRSVTVTLDDGSTHIFANIPSNVPENEIENRAHEDFPGRRVKEIEDFDLDINDVEIERADSLERTQWWKEAVADFDMSQEMRASVDRELPQIDQRALTKHVTSVVGTTAAFIASFWFLSFLFGWIARGFAGIPRGQDFRPTLADGQKS